MLSRRKGALAALSFIVAYGPFAALAAPVVVPPRVDVVPEAEAQAPDREVIVEVELLVAADGTVGELRVVSEPNAIYDEATLAALKKARFFPAEKDGTKTAAKIRYTMTFRARPEPIAATTARREPEAANAPSATPKNPAVPEADQATFGARAVTEAPARETTARSMATTELRMLGTRGDPLRAVELMPGMGRTSFGNPLPLIRGSSPFESQVFYEGLPVPLLYHFGGITSFVPARALDRVDFYPGNFSARYGRVLGGVIDVRARDPHTDGVHGALDVNFIDASASAEATIVGKTKDGAAEAPDAPKVAALVGFRRSYIDAYFSAIAPEELGVRTAPAYYDYQGTVYAKLSRKHSARVFVIGSRDSFELVADRPDDNEPLARGTFEAKTAFHRVQASLKSRFSDTFSQEATVAFGVENYRQNIGAIARQDVDQAAIRARAEWTYRPVKELRLVFGVDHASQRFDGTYEGVRPQFEAGAPVTPSALPRARGTGGTWVHTPALYAEAGLLLADGVTLMPSIRVDHFGPTTSTTLDPRLALRAAVAAKTTLKVGVGKFTQHPQVVQALRDFGNTSIRPGYAMHYSAGVEQLVSDDAKLGMEGFVKTLHDLPFDTRNLVAPYYDNIGTGSVVGLELEARVLPKNRVYGLVSYTLSRSIRHREDEPIRLFENDQTHLASAALAVRLGKGWEASATFRLTSANPRTPVLSATYDAATDQYVARPGPLSSERGPAYHRLDLHVEKTWTFTNWKLMAYLDIQNVYNAANRETLSYNYDYTRSQGSPSFPPFFPSLGIRGEL